MNLTVLKGGSLSSTYLCDDNGFKFIRKHISTGVDPPPPPLSEKCEFMKLVL